MWRFLLPGFAMVAAMLVLLAGALGDLEAWRNWPAMILGPPDMPTAGKPAAQSTPPGPISRPGGGREALVVPPPPLAPLPPIPLVPAPTPAAPPPATPPPAPPAPPTPAPTPTQSVPPPAPPQPGTGASAKAVAPVPPATSPAPTSASREDTAKAQANQIQEAMDRIRARHGAATQPWGVRPATTQPMPQPASPQPGTSRTSVPAPPAATQPMPQPGYIPPAAATAAPAETPRQSLVAARAALAMRQGEEAKRLLGVAQFGILFQRPQPDQPRAMVDQRPAAEIAHAAASVDRGDYVAADRSIALALAIIDSGPGGP